MKHYLWMTLLCFALVVAVLLSGCSTNNTTGLGGSEQIQGASGTDNATNSAMNVAPSENVDETEAGNVAESSSPTRGSTARKSVVYECWYALRKSYFNTSSGDGPFGGNVIDNCVVSNWNYLASDTSAFKYVRGRFPLASLSNDFGTSNNYALKSNVGRGGQCFFFTALILRRRCGYDLPNSYAKLSSGANGPASKAQPGDVIFRKNYHVGICVKVYSDGIDVVDSNWVGTSTSKNKWSVAYDNIGKYWCSEIIGRHPLSFKKLNDEGWQLYSGNKRWY